MVLRMRMKKINSILLRSNEPLLILVSNDKNDQGPEGFWQPGLLPGAVALWPLRFHFRVQALRLGAANAPGRSVDLPQVGAE